MRWQWAFIGLMALVLVGIAARQYAPEASERAAIRQVVREYLAKQYYLNPQIWGIRIAHGYASAVVYDRETLQLFLHKRQGKWEVVMHGNLLTRETIRTKEKGVPDSVFDRLKIPKAGTFGGE